MCAAKQICELDSSSPTRNTANFQVAGMPSMLRAAAQGCVRRDWVGSGLECNGDTARHGPGPGVSWRLANAGCTPRPYAGSALPAAPDGPAGRPGPPVLLAAAIDPKPNRPGNGPPNTDLDTDSHQELVEAARWVFEYMQSSPGGALSCTMRRCIDSVSTASPVP
jgi:hypothetical protein